MLLKKLLPLLLVLASTFVAAQQTQVNSTSEKFIVGYLFPQDDVINPSEIAVEKLTHINYAFADIRDGIIVKGFKNDSLNYSILNALKTRNPKLAIMISVGGWTWSGQFSDMSLTKESRKKFIDSAIEFVDKYCLDGIDYDWEFPNLIGYGNIFRPEDKENYTLLIKETREALDELGKKKNKYYLHTIAAGAFDDYVKNSQMGIASKYLDFINIMAYDLYEVESDSVAGHHSPLFTHPNDKKKLSADAAVNLFLNDGVPSNKIVLGVPFYGRGAEVSTLENHGLYFKAKPVKKPIWASIKNIKTNLENKNGFVRYWDSYCKVPYLFNEQEKILLFYDDEESLAGKCEYIKKKNLKGAMFWEYHSDYESILLNSLYNGLN